MSKMCETCRYWAQDKDYDYDRWDNLAAPFTFKHCSRAMPLWGANEYFGEESYCERVLTEENKDRKFFAQDGSDYHAEVVTRNDFGCLEHEAV